MTVATEERLNRSPTTPTAATRLTAEAAAEAAATPPPPAATPPPPAATPPPPPATSTTPAATPPPPAATSTTPEATGRAVRWRLGDYQTGTLLPSLPRGFFSPVVSIQSGSYQLRDSPPPHTAVASLRFR